jgi:hypothetical protein
VRTTIVNTALSTRVDEQPQQHPPSWLHRAPTPPRVSVADRVALHVGLALVTWSRRPQKAAPSLTGPDPQTRRQLAEQRATREREWLLGIYLSQHRR